MYSIIEACQSFRMSKARNGSISISFSMLREDFINIIGNSSELYLDLGSAGTLKFKLKGLSDNGTLIYASYAYNPYEEIRINRTIKFITLNKKLKEFYDSHMMIENYITGIEDADVIYKIKEVNNIYSISGWRVSEILEELKWSLDIHIDDIVIPSFINYKLSNFVIRQGINLVNAIQSLFPNMFFSIYKLGDTIHISSNIYNWKDIGITGLDICSEYSYETINLEIGKIYLFGDISTPEYVNGVAGQEIESKFRDKTFDIIEKKILNLYGRNYITKEVTMKKTIKIKDYSRGDESYSPDWVYYYTPSDELPSEIRQLADGTYNNL